VDVYRHCVSVAGKSWWRAYANDELFRVDEVVLKDGVEHGGA
jgi:hypothetical protein